LATLLFLAAIGFIAFPTRAFAENLHDPIARAAGARFYATALAMTAVAWWVKWRTGKAMGDVDSRLDPAYVNRLDRKYGLMAAVMVAAAALSFARWELGLGLAGIVTLYHLRPPETPSYPDEAPIVEEEG
jgi:hypothetical protein